MDKKMALKELKNIIDWLEQLDCEVLENDTTKDLVDRLVNLVSYYQAAIIKNESNKIRLYKHVKDLTFTRQSCPPQNQKRVHINCV